MFELEKSRGLRTENVYSIWFELTMTNGIDKDELHCYRRRRALWCRLLQILLILRSQESWFP